MYRQGFDNEKYLKLQSKHIKERIDKFGGKLYLEFGGKLFDDYHASRVLPGFEPDSKIRMLAKLKDKAEIVIVINSEDIEKNKIRGDIGITYDADVLRLIDAFESFGLYIGSVVLTRYKAQNSAKAFMKKLKKLNIKVYKHYDIEGYPSNLKLIVSDDGYGKNDYIETERPLVVVTAPGPGSGKMAVCLSQLYHEQKRGIKAGYAKFETFPIWNLSLTDPVNIAYEAATADLNDVNMIDPFHLEAYGESTVNYNRDVEVFPIVEACLSKILGECPYKSPTDMGVNMAGKCIYDEEAVWDASRNEIIRRYYNAKCRNSAGEPCKNEIEKIELLIERAKASSARSELIDKVTSLDKKTGQPASAIELTDGTIITGKTSDLLGASSAMLLNALKHLAKIDDKVLLIPSNLIEPVQKLKTESFGGKNPRLHTDEILITLCIAAVNDDNAKKALEMLPQLRNCEVHSSVCLSSVDKDTLKKLGINVTCEPRYQEKKLFHK